MLRLLGFRDLAVSSKRRRRSRSGLEPSRKRRRSCSDSGRSAQGMPSENSEANDYRQCRGIRVRGPDAPNPIRSFRETPFPALGDGPIVLIRVDCQKLFLSVEWPDNFETLDNLARLSHGVLYKIVISSPDFKPNISICQIVSREHQKSKKLIKLVGDMMDGSKILIFMDKKKCDKKARDLCAKGWLAFSIHEGKSELERDHILSEFQAGRILILTASDFAARDLDVNDVKYVINYDFPGSLDDYVHWIGLIRTSGRKRTAHTFFTDANARLAKELISLLEKFKQTVTPELAALGCDAPDPRGKIIIPPVCGSKLEISQYGGFRVPVNDPRVLDAAIFALKEVKSQKKLYFVRVLEAYKKMSGCAYGRYYLILEAVEGGEVKACVAIVLQKDTGDQARTIILFGLVDGGELVKLFGTKAVWSGRECNILRLMLQPKT